MQYAVGDCGPCKRLADDPWADRMEVADMKILTFILLGV